ncbi:SDR family oxidoreductase [Pelagerythrobacter rhizovicinus]|uniref:SDR family oxidoreductase n=2 Tax=Pelagerythrobacter rhizovicinus TaxID=2268576 RepID=A0A4Q2KL13_9SPHN|nr:SDR family oxidoreductase [Pelagerythrobacter rhizovicinus]
MKPGSVSTDLLGRTALITGATGYLGSAMAWALAGAGAEVLINARNIENAERLAAKIQERGWSAQPAAFDVVDHDAVAAAAEQYLGDRPLNILVNNAYAGSGGTIEHSSADAYRESYDVAVVSAHRLLHAMLPALRQAVERDFHASVINVASMYGLVSPDPRLYDTAKATNPPFYGAAKAALVQWTRYAACEFGAQGIRVNSISPGPFPSRLVQENSPEFVSRLAERVPLGRVGQASEIAGPLLFLASDASTYVNGANLVVDGGWTAW